MLVYYIVIFLVVLFSGIAEQLDYKPESFDSNATQTLPNKTVSHTRNACYVFILSSLAMVLVAGLRYYVGADYGGYYKYLILHPGALSEHLRFLEEPGYYLICAFFDSIGINDGAYPVFVASFITIGLALFIIYRNTNQLWLASVLFLLLYSLN